MYCFFLFPRPHSSSGCFQTGYVYKGQPKFDGAKSASCPNGPPKGAEWFNIRVVVSSSTPAGEVKVYLKGTLVTSFNPRYPIRKRGGVLVANGYNNAVYYKNFKFMWSSQCFFNLTKDFLYKSKKNISAYVIVKNNKRTTFVKKQFDFVWIHLQHTRIAVALTSWHFFNCF